MRVLVIFTCLVFCHQVAAWPWGSNNAEEAEVTEPSETIEAQGGDDAMAECIRAGQEGRCAFYDCLERRFSCSSNGYTENISKHFCLKVNSNFHLFDDNGKIWLNKTSICLMRDMLAIYRGQSTTCADIREAGIRGINICNDQIVDDRNFCDFIRDNAYPYSQLMGRTEMQKLISLRNSEILSTMITQSLRCGGAALSDAWSSIGSSLMSMGRSLASNLGSMFGWN